MSINKQLKELAEVLNLSPEFGSASRVRYDVLEHEQVLVEFDVATLEYLIKTIVNEYVKRGG